MACTSTEKDGLATNLQDFKKQLMAYSEIKVESKSPLAPHRVGWSGKGGGRKDDMCVAFQLLIYWENYFWNNPAKYSKYF